MPFPIKLIFLFIVGNCINSAWQKLKLVHQQASSLCRVRHYWIDMGQWLFTTSVMYHTLCKSIKMQKLLVFELWQQIKLGLPLSSWVDICNFKILEVFLSFGMKIILWTFWIVEWSILAINMPISASWCFEHHFDTSKGDNSCFSTSRKIVVSWNLSNRGNIHLILNACLGWQLMLHWVWCQERRPA